MIEKDKKSFLEHDLYYRGSEALEKEREYHQTKAFAYEPGNPLGQLYDRANDISVAVDIGCGTGFFSKFLSQKMMVYSIEPSEAALNIAKTLYPNETNINWINGFALEGLQSLKLAEPALFVCLCVLSHLEDENVKEICEQINKIASPKSLLSFSECWGPESHAHLWHIRTQEWWMDRFPGWHLNFNLGAVPIQNVPGRHKGFVGMK